MAPHGVSMGVSLESCALTVLVLRQEGEGQMWREFWEVRLEGPGLDSLLCEAPEGLV